MTDRAGTLLIYAPVPLFRRGDALCAEKQAVNGLRLWAEHFDRVIVMMPEEGGPPPPGWVDLADHADQLTRVQIEPLPTAWRPDQFFRVRRPVRSRIRALIGQADYLSFAIGGLFGDWGAVASFEAHRMGRPFAVWTDRVESAVMRQAIGEGNWRQNLRARLYHRPMAHLERMVIRRAALGLFHGQETYDTYAPYSRNPHVVHDIHISPADHISDETMERKLALTGEGALRLIYAGRADAMKGPLDWVQVLEGLSDRGIAFHATWLGDGVELGRMRDHVRAAGLEDRVELPGFTEDRDQVRDMMQQAHLFLFCHKTPESPRCLIEALAAATPIVGCGSSDAADLISAHGGGRLAPMDDVGALVDGVAQLAQDRAALADLITRARKDGAPFNDEEVFRHRSELIRQFL